MTPTAEESERMLGELQHGRSPFAAHAGAKFDDLRLRMREAATWCDQHFDPLSIRASLRPEHFMPAPLAGSRWAAVDDVVGSRRREVGRSQVRPSSARAGRLLLYFPDVDLSDGAAELESEGFFDAHNAPPWGTWIGYFDDRGGDVGFDSYLLAWVPGPALAMAQAGIDVNPEQCIVWYSDAAVGLQRVLPADDLPGPA